MTGRRVFTPEELVQFMDEYWRKHGIVVGDWEFRPGTGLLYYKGQEMPRLTMKEEEVLSKVIRAFPAPVTAEKIAGNLFSSVDEPKVYIHRVRKKLRCNLIRTFDTQRGYCFDPLAVPLQEN